MKIKLTAAISLISVITLAQHQDTSKLVPATSKEEIPVFKLGEVVIKSSRKNVLSDRITKEEIERSNNLNVSDALNRLPGLFLTASGARNESTISLRGYDVRAVPIYMDGIPVYVPYDGYVDLGRFNTFDLAAIDVSKGFSSMMYGPNALGGAINLISRRPIKKFEYDGSLGMINLNGLRGNLNIGTNLGKFYLQAGYSYLHRDSYILPKNYKSNKFEDGEQRDNSYYSDQKISVKIGWSPTRNHEYVIGYMNQMGEKGNPIYAGKDSLNSMFTKSRYWKWPKWNKETYYFLSNTSIRDKHYIKSRFYYDVFKNLINSYDDDTYTSQSKPYAFKSFYNDYSYGGILEYGTTIIPKNELKFSVQYKQDVHRENNIEEPIRHFVDHTLSFALEDVFSINKYFSIIPGISYNLRANTLAEDYNSKTNEVYDYQHSKNSDVLNAQLGFFTFFGSHSISLSASRKSRFSTIKDRYSYKMGTAIPNPDLKPETSYNFDLSYHSSLLDNQIHIQSSLFYSYIQEAIQNVSNVYQGKSQMQNIGIVQYAGAELGFSYVILNNLSFNGNYSFIKRNSISDAKIFLTDVPEHKMLASIQYAPVKQLNVFVAVEYNSFRYSTSYGTKSPDFTLLNLGFSTKVCDFMRVDIGLNNVFDRNYTIVEGYPQEGRNLSVTLRFFNK